MTTKGARSAFLRSYHIPSILLHYPRLVRSMRRVAILDEWRPLRASATSRHGAAGVAMLLIAVAELIRLRLRHGNIAEQ